MSEPETAERSRRGLTFWGLVTLVPWIIVIRAARAPIRDNSFLWHIRAGTIQADAGAVLTTDPFSYTFGGDPWRTQSWLADLLYGWFDDRVGLAFTPWMLGVLAALILTGAGLAVWAETRSRPALAVSSILTGLLLVPFLNPRPVIWSFLFLALLVLVERDRRLRWTLPLLFWVWASVHGSFPLGALYLVLRVMQDREWNRIRREAPAIVLAVFVTAHGWGIVDMFRAFGANGEALSLMSEWGPPDIVSWGLVTFLVGLLALVAGGAWERIQPRDLWMIVPVVVIALSSARFLLPGWLLLVTVVSRAFVLVERTSLGRRPLRGGMGLGVFIVVLPFLLPGGSHLDEERFPVKLVAKAGPGRLLHDDVIGGYIVYALWPERQVLVDDRAELYGSFLRDFVDARDGKPAWGRFVDSTGAESAILRRDTALAQLLGERGWAEVDEEGPFILLIAGSD